MRGDGECRRVGKQAGNKCKVLQRVNRLRSPYTRRVFASHRNNRRITKNLRIIRFLPENLEESKISSIFAAEDGTEEV